MLEDLEATIEATFQEAGVREKFQEDVAAWSKKRGPVKYFDVSAWLKVCVDRWRLIESSRPDLVMRDTEVLDIGTGFGYFPVVGRHLFDMKSIEATDAPGVLCEPRPPRHSRQSRQAHHGTNAPRS